MVGDAGIEPATPPVCTGVGDRKVAEEIRAKRESDLIEQAVHGRRATATFAESALSYLEAGGAKRFLEPVIRHFGVTPLAKIDQDGVDKGARKLYPNASDATRLRYTPVSAVLQHAAKRGWCAPLFLERLIDAGGDHLKPLVQFLLLTGARLGEALWLDWREVDLVRGHVAFLDTKNGESRGAPLHPRLVATLANLPHREGCVFRRPDGLPYERTKGGDDTS